MPFFGLKQQESCLTTCVVLYFCSEKSKPSFQDQQRPGSHQLFLLFQQLTTLMSPIIPQTSQLISADVDQNLQSHCPTFTIAETENPFLKLLPKL